MEDRGEKADKELARDIDRKHGEQQENARRTKSVEKGWIEYNAAVRRRNDWPTRGTDSGASQMDCMK